MREGDDGPRPEDGQGDAREAGRGARRARVDQVVAQDLRDRTGAREAGADLRDRLAATDREGRFRHRLEVVSAREQQRRRRWALLRALGRLLFAVLAVAAGVLVGLAADDGPTGLAVTLVVLVGAVAVRFLVADLAGRRGAEAWDWQAGRNRLLGRPAQRVQDLDRPSPRRPLR